MVKSGCSILSSTWRNYCFNLVVLFYPVPGESIVEIWLFYSIQYLEKLLVKSGCSTLSGTRRNYWLNLAVLFYPVPGETIVEIWLFYSIQFLEKL